MRQQTEQHEKRHHRRDEIGVGDLPAAVVMRLLAHAPAPDDDGLRLAHGLALPPGAIIRYLSAMTRLCFPARQRSAHADWVPSDVLFPRLSSDSCPAGTRRAPSARLDKYCFRLPVSGRAGSRTARGRKRKKNK